MQDFPHADACTRCLGEVLSALAIRSAPSCLLVFLGLERLSFTVSQERAARFFGKETLLISGTVVNWILGPEIHLMLRQILCHCFEKTQLHCWRCLCLWGRGWYPMKSLCNLSLLEICRAFLLAVRVRTILTLQGASYCILRSSCPWSEFLPVPSLSSCSISWYSAAQL